MRTALHLSAPAGIPELREHIADWLLSRGMTCSPDDVVIVNGAQEARDLTARLLVGRGQPVVFEEPGSVQHRLFLEAHGARLMPVHVDGSGLVIGDLEQVEMQSLLYVTPSSQFPTGAVLSKARRLLVLEWAQKHNSIVIEDDVNCEFTYEGRITTSIRSSDMSDRTLYIGTLAHIIPPSWRLAFMVVPRAIRPTLIRLKSVTNRCTAPLVQRLALRLFESGFMHEQVRKLQRVCEHRRKLLLEELDSWPHGLVTYSPVKSGLLQTIWLPTRINDVAIYSRCVERGIDVAPVSPCFMRAPAQPGLIINFGSVPSEKLLKSMTKLRRTLEVAWR